MPDIEKVVTFTLFSKQINNSHYHRGMFGEKDKVKAIMRGLTDEANKRNEAPPKFVLYVNLIPDWEKDGNGYDNKGYLEVKKNFLVHVNEEFAIDDLAVKDFYSLKDVNEDEKKYLDKLKSGGSNPDLMKTHAIVANKNNQHLQIDTNTKIASFEALYDLTFGQKDDKQYDRLNACVYSDHFVSAHNKIVYTYPDSPLATALSKNYLSFCQKYGNNLDHKKANSNRIYGQLFNISLQECGLTIEGSLSNRSKTYYPANLEKKEEYGLTKAIATAVNRSWDASYKNAELDKLKKVDPVEVGDANIDFMTYAYLVKKHTNILSEHASSVSETSTYKYINNSIRLVSGYSISNFWGKTPPEDKEIRDTLLALSNSEYEFRAMATFYNHVQDSAHQDLIEGVARVIPQTERGNQLSQALFKLNVEELYKNPKKQAREVAEKDSLKVDRQSEKKSTSSPSHSLIEEPISHTTKKQSISKDDIKKTMQEMKNSSENNLDQEKTPTYRK